MQHLHYKLLYPIELVVILGVVIVCALYGTFDISLISPILLYQERITSGILLYCLSLFIALFVTRLGDIKNKQSRGDSLTSFYRKFLNTNSLLYDLRIVHAISLMFVVFIQLKHLIPSVNSAVYDNLLLENERSIFGGKLATEIFIDFFGPSAAQLFSQSYMIWYPYMAVMMFVIILTRNKVFVQEFSLAFVLLWFLGIAVIYAFPTWGPCFSAPEILGLLPETRMTEIQASLWTEKNNGGVFLISGLPSLHLAVTILGSIYLGKVSKILGIVSWIFTLLTIITTIYFGWHFVLDDIASIFLVWLAIIFAKQVRNETPYTA